MTYPPPDAQLIEAVKEVKRQITLKTLVSCSLDQQMAVRSIRNEKSVRESMYTEHEIGVNEHLQWISKLKSDNKQVVFVVLNEKLTPLGIVSINAIDTLHKKADWAFYLDANERGGLGAALEYNLIQYVFEVLFLEKLNCEVIETNKPVVKLHKKFFFVEEGFRRENIVKNGRIGVYFLGLTKNDWINNRTEVYRKYQSIIDKFDIKFEEEEPAQESPLNQIERARAKNNVNWMALLRLSLEQNPSIAMPIVSEILRLDTEISNLTKKLVHNTEHRLEGVGMLAGNVFK